MKKYILISLAGVAALLSSCVVDPYGPGYGAYGPYGEPYFVYGGMNYYSYGGRYYYVEHGHRVYVQHLPSGGHYYHNHVDHYNKYNNNYNKVNYSNNNYNKVNYSNNNYNKGNYSNNYKGQQYSQGHGNYALGNQKVANTGKYQTTTKGSKNKDKDNH